MVITGFENQKAGSGKLSFLCSKLEIVDIRSFRGVAPRFVPSPRWFRSTERALLMGVSASRNSAMGLHSTSWHFTLDD